MGSSIKFNWVLQIKPPENLEVRGSFRFEKSGNRAFPVNAPIDLIDLNRNAIAKVKILSYLNTYKDERGMTDGMFEVIKIYAGTEKRILTNYWIENDQ